MDTRQPKLEARFYQTASGGSPVLDWLRALDAADRKVIGRDLMRLQFGWPVGMPLCRPMGGGLYEIRSDLPSRTIARVLFIVRGGQIVLLHGFIKKTQKTPDADLQLAAKRRKDVEHGD